MAGTGRAARVFQSTLPARGATEITSEITHIKRFQSTLPARGATGGRRAQDGRRHAISIHAPRTGSDHRRGLVGTDPRNFNPRSPHGERPREGIQLQPVQGISIHAPRTGSDLTVYNKWFCRFISIHAPRTGSDNIPLLHNARQRGFQSTLPARGATFTICQGLFNYSISIHAPRTGSDIFGIRSANSTE